MAADLTALQTAVRWQMAGHLGEALSRYQEILAANPGHAEALRLSGLALRRMGDSQRGWRRLIRAATLAPEQGEVWVNIGAVLRDAGHQTSAVTAYGRAITLHPGFAEAHDGLAATLLAAGRTADAVAAWKRGIAACPNRPDLANALGNGLQTAGEPALADSAYRLALAIDPAHAATWANRGVGLRSRSQSGESQNTTALLADALACQRHAVRLEPFFAAAHDGLGQTLLRYDRMRDALPHHRRAIALQPDFAGAYANLGNAYLGLNDTKTAIAVYRHATVLAPAMPDPHRNLGIGLLLNGDFAEGWREYEWRLACADSQTPAIPRPRWNGEPLNGRTILLHTEQGLGDALHFARYIPLVAARGGQVVLCAPPALERLVSGLQGLSRFVRGGEAFSLAGIDVHAPLMSLPYIFESTATDLPAPVAYLAPDPALVMAWRRRLETLERDAAPINRPAAGGPVLRAGVVWAGSPTHGNDRNRSLPLDAVLGLGNVPGVRLVSLQKGPAVAALAARAAGGDPAAARVLNPSDGITDFADTAAIAASLDLVVCVDTSVAHLAGAIGRPTWVLLPFAPDWRWMLHRHDNPWYPTLRLFRQTAPGDWGPVLAEAATRLRTLIGN